MLTLGVCGEKSILPNLTNTIVKSRKEPHVFCTLEPEPLEKINRSRSRLEKKVRSRSRKKIMWLLLSLGLYVLLGRILMQDTRQVDDLT